MIAYTTQSATLDADIWFPVSSRQIQNFNSAIVVYDNCGKAFSLNVPVLVQASTVAPPNPLVISPTDGTSTNGGPQAAVTSPVHFVASASGPQCSNGISAMRIYTAPGVAGYTANGAAIDTYLKMAKGTTTSSYKPGTIAGTCTRRHCRSRWNSCDLRDFVRGNVEQVLLKVRGPALGRKFRVRPAFLIFFDYLLFRQPYLPTTHPICKRDQSTNVVNT